MTRATGEGSPTAIRGLHRNITVEPAAKLQGPERPIAAALSREGRILPEAELTSSRARDNLVVVIGPAADRAAALFPVWTGAEARRVTLAVVVLQADRAFHQEVMEAAAGVQQLQRRWRRWQSRRRWRRKPWWRRRSRRRWWRQEVAMKKNGLFIKECPREKTTVFSIIANKVNSVAHVFRLFALVVVSMVFALPELRPGQRTNRRDSQLPKRR